MSPRTPCWGRTTLHVDRLEGTEIRVEDFAVVDDVPLCEDLLPDTHPLIEDVLTYREDNSSRIVPRNRFNRSRMAILGVDRCNGREVDNILDLVTALEHVDRLIHPD